MIKNVGITLLFALLIGSAYSQTTINVMSYNVLNYPLGDMQDRADTLKVITDYVQPDLFLLQELKSEEGLQTILQTCFGESETPFMASEFVPQISNPNSSWKLQQALIYNSEMFGLAEQDERTSVVRDLNIFKMYFKDEQHLEGDTTYLYVFVTHLKSSQGDDNEQSRLEMMESFTNYFDDLPEDALALFGGDFNVYNSGEPAYQLIVNINNHLVWKDPIEAPGNWHSSAYPFRQVHTQSTRTGEIFGDGSGGGMDDRFDFIMASQALMDGNSPIHYAPFTYEALGNTGDCYNGTILDCSQDNPLPPEMLTALYHMSDHLPVVMQLEAINAVSIEEAPEFILNIASLQSENLQFQLKSNGAFTAKAKLFDLHGNLIQNWQEQTGRTINFRSQTPTSSGVYVLVIESDQGTIRRKVMIQ
ncbi:MAG: T9SS type A sorting domain-containing protein [Bacteroidota bacterium]